MSEIKECIRCGCRWKGTRKKCPSCCPPKLKERQKEKVEDENEKAQHNLNWLKDIFGFNE